MNRDLSEFNKKALLKSLFIRNKNRINFLNNKSRKLISELTKKSDTNKIQKIREDILK